MTVTKNKEARRRAYATQ